MDVDGVLTDATLFYGPDGEVFKRFSARDGFALRLAKREGIAVAILSGRSASSLLARLRDLEVPSDLVVQGSKEKARDLEDLAVRLGVGVEEIAFMGDDIPDLPALALAGLSICPADAADEVADRCDHVCAVPGGCGAVREAVEVILRARGRWAEIVEAWAQGKESMDLETRSSKEAAR